MTTSKITADLSWVGRKWVNKQHIEDIREICLCFMCLIYQATFFKRKKRQILLLLHNYHTFTVLSCAVCCFGRSILFKLVPFRSLYSLHLRISFDLIHTCSYLHTSSSSPGLLPSAPYSHYKSPCCLQVTLVSFQMFFAMICQNVYQS